MGIPGRSYALHVAKHLGMPNHILEDAESMIDPARTESETILQQLQREREETARIRDEAEKSKLEADIARRELQSKLSNVTKAQEDMIEKSRMELRREADQVRRDLRKIVSQAKQDTDLAAAQRAIGRLKGRFADPTWLPVAPPPEAPPSDDKVARPLQANDEVEIKGLNVNATVIDRGKDEMIELQMGGARIELKESQLRLVKPAEDKADPKPQPSISVDAVPATETVTELDVRGFRVHEAEDEVKKFIDDASMSGLRNVRVIHGDGTGALREAIRVILAGHSLVGTFSAAPRHQGGNGATLVELA